MKFQVFTVLFLLGFQAFGQTEGYILYKYENPNPLFPIEHNRVYFNKEHSILIRENGEDKILDNQALSKTIITYPYVKYYINIQEKKGMKQKQLSANTFLRTEFDVESLNWKIHSEKKTILNFVCSKATTINPVNGTTVVAWFTSEISVSVGLPLLNGLPGAILSVEYESGATETAQKVVFEKVPASKLQITEGELVSAKKYDKAKSKTEKWLDKMDKMTSQEMGIDADN